MDLCDWWLPYQKCLAQNVVENQKNRGGVRKEVRFDQTVLNFKHLDLFFSSFQDLEGSSSWGLTERSDWSFSPLAGRPQVIHNILKAASPTYKKKSCCLCHAAQNCVWFSFWLLHFPLTTHLIWCALSLPDLITSFLELACCSNWLRGKYVIK